MGLQGRLQGPLRREDLRLGDVHQAVDMGGVPVSAYGWKFEKDRFMRLMQEAVDAPVINVKEIMA